MWHTVKFRGRLRFAQVALFGLGFKPILLGIGIGRLLGDIWMACQ